MTFYVDLYKSDLFSNHFIETRGWNALDRAGFGGKHKLRLDRCKTMHRALLALRDPEGTARRIVAEGLSVREVEALAAAEAEPSETPRPGRPRLAAERPAPVRSLELRLHQALGVSVSYRPKDDETGEIRLRYANRAELQTLLDRLKVPAGD